jgi:hypothetical protein
MRIREPLLLSADQVMDDSRRVVRILITDCALLCRFRNRAFSDWPTVFPNATCATALIDRLVHHGDVLAIEDDNFRSMIEHPAHGAVCTQ